MKNKKISVIILTLIATFMANNVTTFASTESSTVSITNEKKEDILDITNDSNYFVKKGQVSLTDLNLSISNENKLEVSPKTRGYQAVQDSNELNDMILNDSKLEEDIKEIVKSGINITDIGYSEALLKVNESNEIVPVKKSDSMILTRGYMGTPKYDGKLTLYTFVDTAVANGSRFSVAYSDATWSGFDGFNWSASPAQGEDYISIEIPDRYTIMNDYFWGSYNAGNLGTPPSRLSEISKSSMIYAFDEFKQLTGLNVYANWVRIGARGQTNNLTPNPDMYHSQYVHTFSKIKLSPTFTPSGIDWGYGEDDKVWKLSSYVSTTF